MQDGQVNVHAGDLDPACELGIAGNEIGVFGPLGGFLGGRVRGRFGFVRGGCGSFYRLDGFPLFFSLYEGSQKISPPTSPAKAAPEMTAAKSALVRCFIN